MPELAGKRTSLEQPQYACNELFTEVERAAALIRELGKGRTIERVETTEDRIVYGDLPHGDFVRLQLLLETSECPDAVTTRPKAAAVVGRTLLDVGRYGKLFYLILDGPKHPVLHLGMTGAIQVGTLPFDAL
jgi:formamidopyrimidine-DNA glycosylase